MPPRKTGAEAKNKPADTEVAEEKMAGSEEAAPDPAAYAGSAAEIAAEARALADDTRDRLAALCDDIADLGQQERTPAQGPVWDGVRRITMSGDDLTRALDGLRAVAADLAAKASQ
jgi:hypothetical protein